MSAPQSMVGILGLSELVSKSLSKREMNLFDGELMMYLISHFKNIFQRNCVMERNIHKSGRYEGDTMSESNTLISLLREILATGEYTLHGIASYTGFHVDVIHEVAAGLNAYPSISLFCRLVELHRYVRRDIYDAMREKIISNFRETHHQYCAELAS